MNSEQMSLEYFAEAGERLGPVRLRCVVRQCGVVVMVASE
jgi:hypothetical protein